MERMAISSVSPTMRAIPMLLPALVAGSGAASTSTAQPPASGPAPSASEPRLPALSERQRALLTRLDDWCGSYPDECDVYERPEAHPGREPSGETGGWLGSARGAFADAGVEVVWDASARRYEPRLARDVRTVVGGTFSVDHLGPDAHAAIGRRVSGEAGLALGLFVRWAESLDAAALSSLHPSALLALTRGPELALTRVATDRLAALYRRAIDAAASPPEDPHRLDRLRDRLRALAP